MTDRPKSESRAKQIAREAEAQLIQRHGWHKASPDELRLAEYASNLTLEEAAKICDSHAKHSEFITRESDAVERAHIEVSKLLAAAIRAMMNTTK